MVIPKGLCNPNIVKRSQQMAFHSKTISGITERSFTLLRLTEMKNAVRKSDFLNEVGSCLEFEQRNIEEPTKPWMAGISIAASTSSCSLPDWKSQVKKSLKRMKAILGRTIKKEQNVLRNLVKTKWEGVTTKDIDCQSPVKVH